MRNLTIAIVAILLIASGCEADKRKVVGYSDDVPAWAGGDYPVHPMTNVCRLLEETIPGFQCSYSGGDPWVRHVRIDGNLVADTFEFYNEVWTARELAMDPSIINVSAAMEDDGGGEVPCPYRNITYCKLVWVLDGTFPLGGHWEVRCRTYDCLFFESPD